MCTPHGRLLIILHARDSLPLSPDEGNTLGKPEALESEGLLNQPSATVGGKPVEGRSAPLPSVGTSP